MFPSPTPSEELLVLDPFLKVMKKNTYFFLKIQSFHQYILNSQISKEISTLRKLLYCIKAFFSPYGQT